MLQSAASACLLIFIFHHSPLTLTLTLTLALQIGLRIMDKKIHEQAADAAQSPSLLAAQRARLEQAALGASAGAGAMATTPPSPFPGSEGRGTPGDAASTADRLGLVGLASP